jgi:RNA polymerase sigma-70 factor (ECF subfamily)
VTEATGVAESQQKAFHEMLGEARPKLHRYCARMTGSAIDGEDVVQEAILKALEAFAGTTQIASIEGWLFRIAHNTALDFLRRRARQAAAESDEDAVMIADPAGAADRRQVAAAGLRTFMHLPVAQRSTVILMDLLGYTIQEIGAITEATVPAIKASLHRGRARLREVAEAEERMPPPVLAAAERARLGAYVDRFNARDFDSLRELLAEDARLDLVNRAQRQGRKNVGDYFTNYARITDAYLAPGLVDGVPAILVYDADDRESGVKYIILLDWAGEAIHRIRDYRFARYVLEGAEIVALP